MVGKNLQTHEETSTKYWFKRDASRDTYWLCNVFLWGKLDCHTLSWFKERPIAKFHCVVQSPSSQNSWEAFRNLTERSYCVILWMNVLIPTSLMCCLYVIFASWCGASLARRDGRVLSRMQVSVCESFICLMFWLIVKFCFWPRLCNGATVVFKLFMTSVGSL